MVIESGTQRKAPWPAQHRAALSIIVSVAAPLLPLENTVPDIGIDYTADGLNRLLAHFEDLDVAVSTAWSTAALSTYPQMARNCQDRGHELALSTVGPPGLPDGPMDLAGRISDLPVVGLLAGLPGSGSVGEHFPGNTALAAPRWMIDGSGGDMPRLQPAADGSADGAGDTVILPVAPYWIDRQWWQADRPSPPSFLLEAWSAGLASVRTFGGIMTVILHPHLSGRPGHAETIVRFVDEAIASADVWIARADQIASWWTETATTNRT